jgi:hypothetical protein
MSNEAVIPDQASDLKQAAAQQQSSTSATSSSFSVTDILSPLEVVAAANSDYARQPRNGLESYMGPSSPITESVNNNGGSGVVGATANGGGVGSATNNFLAYSSYSPRSVTPISAASAAAMATSAAYPHMHSMTQLNTASTFSSGYCQPNSADLSHHYQDMRSTAAASAAGWYSSPAADPRFASEYCKFKSFYIYLFTFRRAFSQIFADFCALFMFTISSGHAKSSATW